MLIISSQHDNGSLAAREKAAGELVFVEKDDNAAIRRLQEEADKHDPQADNGRRLECYIILGDLTSLWLLQTVGLPKRLEERVD